MEGLGTEARIANWLFPQWNIEYVVSTPAAGKWQVKAEVNAPKPVELFIKANNVEQKNPVAATEGGDGVFDTRSLGTITLPAGQSSIHIRGEAHNWTPIQVRKVTLTPAE
jgi:hypothetical protein